MSRFVRGLVGCAMVFVAAPAVAFDDATLARQTYEKIIVPGYTAFADASRLLGERSEALCKAPSVEALTAARDGARGALLALGRIEPVRFGPITQNKRLDRLLFYPDAHGIVGKQTAKLLAKRDEADIDPKKLEGASVAVQGFGALDVALFGRGSEELAGGGPDAAFRCNYVKALAVDIAQIARETLDDWAGGYGKTWLNAGAAGNTTYLSAKEPTQALYRAYVTQLEVMRLQRLSPLVPDAKPAGPLLPQGGLALPFVLAGIEGERALLGENGFTAADLSTSDKERDAVAILGSVETDLGFALRAGEAAVAMARDPFTDAKARERLVPLLLSLKNAEDVGRAALGDLTGQTLGFNSLDGD